VCIRSKLHSSRPWTGAGWTEKLECLGISLFPDSGGLRNAIGAIRFPCRQHRPDPPSNAPAGDIIGWLRHLLTASLVGFPKAREGSIYKRFASSWNRNRAKGTEPGSHTCVRLRFAASKVPPSLRLKTERAGICTIPTALLHR
jgi:hypothetical protein